MAKIGKKYIPAIISNKMSRFLGHMEYDEHV